MENGSFSIREVGILLGSLNNVLTDGFVFRGGIGIVFGFGFRFGFSVCVRHGMFPFGRVRATVKIRSSLATPST
jgi:hypothetical protein